MNRSTPFVVLFVARSGSTYLMGMLDSHPQIITRLEVFAKIRRRHRKLPMPEKEKVVAAMQREWSDSFLREQTEAGVRAWGFKTKFRDIQDPADFGSVITQNRVSIVLLERRNVVKSTVSLCRALELRKHAGVWNLEPGTEKAPPTRIDPDWFFSRLRSRENQQQMTRNYATSLGGPHIAIAYEDLLTNPSETCEDLCDFLGVDRVTLTADIRKNTSDDLRQDVENFEELLAACAGTRYESMFHEVLVRSDPS